MNDIFYLKATGEIVLNIRTMVGRDMPEVLNIAQESFEDPWSEEEFDRYRKNNPPYKCMVAERCDNRIVGYMIRNRFHILNFAVRPDMWRQGVGTAMADKLIGKLSVQRRSRIVLKVRETNLAAQQFWKAKGFRAVSVLRDYHDDTTEDAYVMHYRLDRGVVPAYQGVKRNLGELTL